MCFFTWALPPPSLLAHSLPSFSLQLDCSALGWKVPWQGICWVSSVSSTFLFWCLLFASLVLSSQWGEQVNIHSFGAWLLYFPPFPLPLPHFTNLADYFSTLFKMPLPPPLPFEHAEGNICQFYAITIGLYDFFSFFCMGLTPPLPQL